MNVPVIFVPRSSRNGELLIPSLSAGIVRQMASNKFQLCSSHVTLKMTYKFGSAVLPTVNLHDAQFKTRSNQTGMYHYFHQTTG